MLEFLKYLSQQEKMMEEEEWSSSDSSEEGKTVYKHDSTNETNVSGPRTSKHRKKVRYVVYLDITMMLFLIIYVIITVGVYLVELHLNPQTTIEVDYANTGTKMVWMLQVFFSTFLRLLELLVDVQLLKATKPETNPRMARIRASGWFSLKSFTVIISAIFLAILFVSPPQKWAVDFRVEQVIFCIILTVRLLSLLVVYVFIEELQYISISVLSPPPPLSASGTPTMEAFTYSLHSQPIYNFQRNRTLM